MTGLLKRERPVPARFDVFERFDRMFDDWMTARPFRRLAMLDRDWEEMEGMIRVDELHDNGTLVIRAELPGIDPDADVELTVEDGMLHMHAERREEEETEEKGYLRHELRTGSFSRTLPLPEGVTESDITAEYKDGILEVRVPAGEVAVAPAPTKIPITTS
ncbi:MAG TPA: Hsp20/alpha crystallin family protein [Acidimicrobiales bacterium]|jgi:HSP20 family protein|nr:Hsp20/alpha crystallin family protein [Acidimicrobiales bacterium]